MIKSNINIWEILVSSKHHYDYDDYKYKNKLYNMLIIVEYQVGSMVAKWDLNNNRNDTDFLPRF